MRLFDALSASLPLLSALASVVAAGPSGWTYEEAYVSVETKGSGAAGTPKELFRPRAPLTAFQYLGPEDTLKVSLTVLEDKTPKRPHQAYLVLREPTTGLEESFPLKVTQAGKADISLTHKDLPIQHLAGNRALNARITIGSFGGSIPIDSLAFMVYTTREATAPPLKVPAPPTRYKKQPLISHIFRADAKSPPVFITLVVSALVFATLPVLLGTWLTLGGNLAHVSEAFSTAPAAHAVFYGSILALEGVFFLYYLSWTLFQTLPAAAIVGTVAFVSGSKALSEVQGRRLAGKR